MGQIDRSSGPSGRLSGCREPLNPAQYIARMKKRTQTGFTLYELLITVLVVGAILTLGIPNMTEFTRNGRITTSANDFHAAFHLARSEAARARANVTICASNNSMDDAADCGGTWDRGMIVFMDIDGSLTRNGVNETVLRRHPAINSNLTLAVANDATYFSFGPGGLGRGNVGGADALTQVIVCDDRGTEETTANSSAARLFVATPLGRATVVRDFDTVEDALVTMGKACP